MWITHGPMSACGLVTVEVNDGQKRATSVGRYGVLNASIGWRRRRAEPGHFLTACRPAVRVGRVGSSTSTSECSRDASPRPMVQMEASPCTGTQGAQFPDGQRSEQAFCAPEASPKAAEPRTDAQLFVHLNPISRPRRYEDTHNPGPGPALPRGFPCRTFFAPCPSARAYRL